MLQEQHTKKMGTCAQSCALGAHELTDGSLLALCTPNALLMARSRCQLNTPCSTALFTVIRASEFMAVDKCPPMSCTTLLQELDSIVELTHAELATISCLSC